MTREEIADKFEELVRGIRKGKTLEENVYGGWKVMPEERLNAFNVNSFRVKPEVEYIPFTADDWREFASKTIIWKDADCHVSYWDKFSVRLWNSRTNTDHIAGYDELLNDGAIFKETDKPFGKQVQS